MNFVGKINVLQCSWRREEKVMPVWFGYIFCFGILNYLFVLSTPTFLTTVSAETASYELLIKMKNVKWSVILLVTALRKRSLSVNGDKKTYYVPSYNRNQFKSLARESKRMCCLLITNKTRSVLNWQSDCHFYLYNAGTSLIKNDSVLITLDKTTVSFSFNFTNTWSLIQMHFDQEKI